MHIGNFFSFEVEVRRLPVGDLPMKRKVVLVEFFGRQQAIVAGYFVPTPAPGVLFPLSHLRAASCRGLRHASAASLAWRAASCLAFCFTSCSSFCRCLLFFSFRRRLGRRLLFIVFGDSLRSCRNQFHSVLR